MKGKKFLTALLATLSCVCLAMGGVACVGSGSQQVEQTEIEKVYAQYVIYAEAQGQEPLSYEEWLASIKGESGKDGVDGKSAYQIWLDNGNTGTQADFLEWLKGQDGADGKDGVDGKDGQDGKDGIDGKDGADGQDGVDGKDGVDGEDGSDGQDGEDGKSAYQIWLDNGNEGTEEDFLNWLKDGESHTYGEWVALYVGDEYCNEAFFYRTCIDCAKMEWKQGTDDDHVWCEDYAHNKAQHWIECEACDAVKDAEEHSLDNEGVCVVCHAEIQNNVVVHEAVPYDGSEVTVTFYHTMGAMYREILDEYIPVFNEMYPNITISHDNMGDYDGLRDQITYELAAGNSPTMAYCYPDHVALYNEKNAVVSLDDYIMSDAIVTHADGTTETMGYTQAQINDFISAFFEEGRVYEDGKMYTLPIMKSTEVLYYNKTAFEENGWSVPTTWAEMEELCAKIKAKYPNDIPFGYDNEANFFITLAEQFGSPYTSSKKGEYFLFNNDTNRAFMEEMRSWYEAGYFTTEEIYGSYTSNLFTETDPDRLKIFMCIGSSAGAPYQCPSKNEDGSYPFEVGVAMIPQVDTSNPKAVLQGPSVCLFEKENPQETAAAWLFAKFLTTCVEYQARMSMQGGYAPVIKSAQEHPAYAQFLASADGNAGLQAAVIKQALAQADAYYVSPAFVGATAARQTVGELLQTCLVTPLTGYASAADLIKAYFDAAITALEYDYGK